MSRIQVGIRMRPLPVTMAGGDSNIPGLEFSRNQKNSSTGGSKC